jgi:hypothetical protein
MLDFRPPVVFGAGDIGKCDEPLYCFDRAPTPCSRNEDLLPVIEDIQAGGLITPPQIADGLNERGITAARGETWSAIQVRRILKSLKAQKANTHR